MRVQAAVRKYLRIVALPAVGIGLALLVVWIVGSSETFHDCVEKAKNDQPYEALYKNVASSFGSTEIEWLRLDRACAGDFADREQGAISAVSTFVIAIFTAILGIFTVRLARATKIAADAAKESARIAREALIMAERAFVFVIDFDSTPVWSGAGIVIHLRVKPIWRNSGSTPTRNMYVRVQWTHHAVAEPAPNIGNFDGVYPTKMFLAPQAQEWTQAITIPRDILERVQDMEENVVIWGRADYDDIFDGTAHRFTQWCSQLVIENDGHPTVEFVPYGDFNGSDEDTRQKTSADD